MRWCLLKQRNVGNRFQAEPRERDKTNKIILVAIDKTGALLVGRHQRSR